MVNVLDQTLDLNGQELYRIVSLYPLPEFVKEASQADVCGTDDTPPHLFADQVRRLYPIHSPAATVVSAIFFAEKQASLNSSQQKRISDRIAEAARYWKVQKEVDALTEKVAQLNTVDLNELPDDVFAVVWTNADGSKGRRYPVRNASETKAAADWLMKYRDQLPFAERNQIATKILEKAAQFGTPLNGQLLELEKMSGAGACAAADVVAALRTRARITGKNSPSQLRSELLKLAQACEDNTSAVRHYDILHKIASVMDDFDRQNGLVEQYGAGFERPEDILFAVSEKVAAEISNELVGTLTGNYYKKADLERLSVTDLADMLGDDFAREVSAAGALVNIEKLASIVPTLPLNDAELFDELVMAAGIYPFAKKSAEVGIAISAEEQMALARAHKPAPGSLWLHVRH